MATDKIKAALFNKKCFFFVPSLFLYYTAKEPVSVVNVLLETGPEALVKRRWWKPKTNFIPALAFCPTVEDPTQQSKN